MKRKILLVVMIMTLLINSLIIDTSVIVSASDIGHINRSKQLKTLGNKVVLAEDETKEIRLTGMNVPSLEWDPGKGENVIESLIVSMDLWNSNVIRLPVHSKFWAANALNESSGLTYRETIDMAVKAVEARGKYLIIDLHEYDTPIEKHKTFWYEVAEVYKNNPAVLFGLLNEPLGTSWAAWRDGGVHEPRDEGKNSVGHQVLVELIRDLGAKNVLIAGGLDYAFIISGIVGKHGTDTTRYALDDKGSGADGFSKAGNGIIYDTHIYTWKKDWAKNVDPVRAEFPIIVGEFGWDAIESNHISYGDKDPNWMNKLFDWMDDEKDGAWSKAHFTGWCLHVTSTPRILKNWRYEPTDFLGQYIYDKLRQENPKAGNTIDTVYTKNFESGNFSRYLYTKTGNAEIKSAVESNTLKISYTKPSSEDKAAVTFNRNPGWFLNDLNQIKFRIQGVSGTKLRLGVKEAEGEIWTKDITLSSNNSEQHIINVSQLTKAENYKGDGKYSPTNSSVYIEVLSTSGTEKEIRINEIEYACLASGEVVKPADVPYVPRNFEQIIDMENDNNLKQRPFGSESHESSYGSKGSTNSKIVSGIGYDESNGFEVTIKGESGFITAGGIVCDWPENMNFSDGKYFSFLAKGSGGNYSLRVELMCSGAKGGSQTITLKNDEWYQFVFDLDKDFGIWDAEKLSELCLIKLPF